MINTDYPNELRCNLVSAIKGCFADCSDQSELYIAGNCIVEILSALSMSDDELVSVLESASGDAAEVDEYIDKMIANIRE
ncbi:hypothetical protein [Pantoea sp. GM_Pan_4]|uniref:hypothetical protein n=1 Tax=Pantoea sp. GM_Pan_4 TaxID=2937389 RepID=UPI00226ADB58|nr:hypothetical protein [Pantoea sp. GM_Pan_4]